MKFNKFLLAALSAAVLSSGIGQTGELFAGETHLAAQAATVQSNFTNQQAEAAAANWMGKVSYVQSGGAYQEGEYKTFVFKNMTYRYLSGDIDTKQELLHYLEQSATKRHAEKFISSSGIVQQNGKLAQPEADGGSLLDWSRTQALPMKSNGSTANFKIVVPVGETTEKAVYLLQMKKTTMGTWKVNELTYKKEVTSDIPGNINPAFVFFHFLLTDSSVSEDQLLSTKVLDVDEFKKGIERLEIRSLEEQGWAGDKVEYAVTFHADLADSYKGALKEGENRLYFLVDTVGEMEFKIAGISASSVIK